jgi:hypothetical protein
MGDPHAQVLDLIFGRWRSQILAAGTELGLFDRLDPSAPRTARQLAGELHLDPDLLYRLMRAQAAIGLLAEDAAGGFVLTESGALLRADHPGSLAAMARLEEGPQHYALWRHLPAMVRDGRQNAFQREFGHMAFEHTRVDADYAGRFDAAMTSYSTAQAAQVLEALKGTDLTDVRVFCDVAGGRGYMACALVEAYPGLSAVVLDLPEVVANPGELWAHRRGLTERCSYVGGDMFREVPRADAYGLKMILHDWNDDECVENIVPGHDTPHFAKLFDVHMMCWGTGRERTEAEYGALLTRAGFRVIGAHHAPGSVMGVIEGACGETTR